MVSSHDEQVKWHSCGCLCGCRETDPLGSAVISMTMVSGGTAFNVIPDKIVLEGTLRTLTDDSSTYLKRRIQEASHGVVRSRPLHVPSNLALASPQQNCEADALGEQVAEHQAKSYDCAAEVSWREDVHPYYPPTVNDRNTHEFASDVAVRCGISRSAL